MFYQISGVYSYSQSLAGNELRPKSGIDSRVDFGHKLIDSRAVFGHERIDSRRFEGLIMNSTRLIHIVSYSLHIISC